MGTIAVFGSANMDLVTTVSRLPAPGETLLGSDLVTVFGGKGANQAVAAARLGAAGTTVEFIGAVGDDAFGRRYLDHLREEHVGTEFVSVSEDKPTGCALILVETGGQNIIVVAPGANHAVTPDAADKAVQLIRRADVVLLQLEIPLETVERVIRLANREGTPVIFNPSPVDNRFRFEDLRIQTLIANEGEVERLSCVKWTDRDQLNSALGNFLSRGVERVVLTQGKDATVISDSSGIQKIPTIPITPVDTVGAGDTFAGAFAVAITEGKDPAAAARFANVAAALSTLKLGAQTSMPNRREVDERLKTLALD